VRTSAKREGDEYVINGQKTFITNGQLADLVIVVCKTDAAKGAKARLILVERERAASHAGAFREARHARAGHLRAFFFRRAGAGDELARRRGARLRAANGRIAARAARVAITAVALMEAGV